MQRGWSHDGRGSTPVIAAIVALALASAALVGLPRVAAADSPSPSAAATLRIDPPSINVNAGQTFTVNVIQNAAVATTGAQTNLEFDQSLLQVVDMKPGPAYSQGLFLFGSSTDGTNKSVAAELAAANKSGAVRNVATFLLPGSSTVPAGDAVLVTFTLKALGGASGSVNLGLQPLIDGPLSMLDANGVPLTVAATGSSVTIGSSAAGGSPAASAAVASTAPSIAPTAAPGATAGSSASEALSVVPSSPQLAVGASATISVVLNSSIETSGVTATLLFDQTAIQVTKVEAGPAWSQATIVAGGNGGSQADAIAQANKSGAMRVGVLLVGSTAPPAVADTVMTFTVTGIANGTTTLSLESPEVLDGQSSSVPVTATAANLTVGSGGGSGGLPVLPVAILILFIVAVGLVVRTRRSGAGPSDQLTGSPPKQPGRPGGATHSGSYFIALALGLIPVALFLAMVALLVANALPALADPGLSGLLSDKFAGNLSAVAGDLGLLPAIWGTLEITVIAVVIALPVSLAMAIVSSEFPMGPVGRILRPLLGVLSGIPPIVYAVASVVLVTVFMIPKFAANSTFGTFDPARIGASSATWPPADVPFNPGSYPWDVAGGPNSTLLGGVVIALLLIPFLSAMIFDALQNVPSAAREASFSVGANRSHTLRRVILPMALPGIVAALSLAILKALGDTLIIGFAVGWEANSIPTPVFDVLERTPSLAAEGAGLLGGFNAGGSCRVGAQCSTGYASGVLLLVLATVLVLATTSIQTRLRRRVQA